MRLLVKGDILSGIPPLHGAHAISVPAYGKTLIHLINNIKDISKTKQKKLIKPLKHLKDKEKKENLTKKQQTFI